MTTLRHERLPDGIEVLRLDRPEVRNAMNRALLAELEETLAALAADDTLRVLVFSTTNERALCAGADVGESLTAQEGVERMEAFSRFYTAVEAFPAPTIAVCVGNVVGAGAELVAGCDLRVGGDNLKLAFAGAKLGVPVGPARLTPLVGLSRAKELIFTGRVLGLDEGLALGLLARGAPAAEAEGVALALAQEIAQRPPAGLRALKDAFRVHEGLPERVTRENDGLVAFQRSGTGLPQGPRG